MLEQLEGPFPATVQEVVPRQVSLQQLTEVLKRLAEEGISIRNLRGILEILADRARGETDPIVLTERVREGLSRFITHQVARPDGSVVAYLVDRELEDIVSGAVRHAPDGSYLALPPDVTREILAAVRRCVQSDIEKGKTPVLLADQSVRRYIKRLVSLEFPECMVLGFQELDPAHKIQPLGRVAL
jgi:type III secretory pathway component EscV